MMETGSGLWQPDEGMYCWIMRAQARSPAAQALFLDRDGVIVEEVGYLARPEDVQLIPDAVVAISRANQLGVPVVVVTNQAGIGRGRYGWSEFESVNREMVHQLGEGGATLDAIFACPFHPDALPPYRAIDHPGRKPEPGMLLKAARDMGIDLATSWIVGDTLSDIKAGGRAGLAGAVLVLTGHGRRDSVSIGTVQVAQYHVLIAPTLGAAVTMIPMLAR